MINIGKEIFNTHISSAPHQSYIIAVDESKIKKSIRMFFECGISSSLEVLASDAGVLSSISKGLLKVLDCGQKLKFFFNPHLKEIEITSFDNFSQTREWKKAVIRNIAWNPHCFKLAVACVDDSIRIYTNEEQSIVLLLKNGLQKSVTSLAWRPLTAATLAVGCQNGFLVWTLDPNSLITRPLSQAAQFKHGSHFPVTALEWNSNGSLLATASLKDSSILIWDIEKNSCVPLKRVSPPGLHLKWSSNGAFLFASTVSNVFRVWDTKTWKSDRWTVNNGHIKSFEWSPCARYLLFLTSEDNFLYSLGFGDEMLFNQNKQQIKPQQAIPIADLSKIKIEHSEIGGKAQQLVWNGRYLAISFKDTNSIAIFQTNIQKHALSIVPSSLISGIVTTEYPTFIQFQPNYKNMPNVNAIVLTIGWSSGRVQFFPFT